MRHRSAPTAEYGAISILVLGIVLGVVALFVVLGAVGGTYVAHAELQQAADVAAARIEAGAGDAPIERARWIAARNGAQHVSVRERDGRVLVRVARRAPHLLGISAGAMLHAEAEAVLPSDRLAGGATAGEYHGPLEVVVGGARLCPRVARAWRAMSGAAIRAGISLVATSGYRSYAEQALLYARLGPAIAAPPGTSLHHAATEVDAAVGPAGSPTHRWLTHHATGYGFVQRYPWEPWHWGFVAGC